MLGGFSATSLGMVLIYIALAATATCSLFSVWLGVRSTRPGKETSPPTRIIVPLLPFAVAAVMWCIAKTEHLGFDGLLLIIGIPLILLLLHTLPLAVVYWRSRADAAVRRARGRLLLGAGIGNIASLCVATLAIP